MTAGRRTREPACVEIVHCDVVLGDRKVLDDVSFTLRPGERWALVGANGAGKTLFLKLLRGDVWPTPTDRGSRTYRHEGERQQQPPPAGERWPYIGPERQDRYERYDWNFKVREVVTTGLFDEDHPLTTPTRAQRARVTRLLRRFGLAGLERRRLLSLSYGQRRLVMIARAFAREPPLLLLDEVFNGLDRSTRARLMRALERPGRTATWVLSAHRAADLPRSVTHLVRLESGTIIERRRLHRRDIQSPERPGHRNGGAVTRNLPPRPIQPRCGFRIACADVYRDYRRVLQQVDWSVEPGQHWGVVGANGAGKSTLLRLIYGDLHPALGGYIERWPHVPGTPLEAWKRRTGFVSPELQAEHAHAGSIEDVVVSGLRASVGLDARPTRRERQRARHWLDYFGIATLASRTVREVSYGQLRLALLARAMVSAPGLLLLDEPCTGLDSLLRTRVLDLVEQLAQSGVQIIMAAHRRDDLVPSIAHLLEIRPDGCVRIAPRESPRQQRHE